MAQLIILLIVLFLFNHKIGDTFESAAMMFNGLPMVFLQLLALVGVVSGMMLSLYQIVIVLSDWIFGTYQLEAGSLWGKLIALGTLVISLFVLEAAVQFPKQFFRLGIVLLAGLIPPVLAWSSFQKMTGFNRGSDTGLVGALLAGGVLSLLHGIANFWAHWPHGSTFFWLARSEVFIPVNYVISMIGVFGTVVFFQRLPLRTSDSGTYRPLRHTTVSSELKDKQKKEKLV